MPLFNSPKLLKELQAAGIPVIRARADGTIDFADTATQQQRDLAVQIEAAHDATDYAFINRQDVLTRLQNSALWGKTPVQIYTAMQNQMDAWTSLADARASLRVWLPLMAAAIFWLTSHQE